jgi:UDP-N-acetylglucosamine--N-acetylmuramyl-(pentapeptide) pyrophosphoryl-undecaprenol N-acetylglucosamine transferase
MKKRLKWVIVAGGTGGHIFPGIAVAEELKAQGKEVCFFSGIRKIEMTIFKNKDFKVYRLNVEGFIGKPFKDRIRAILKLSAGIFKAYRLIKKINPDVVFATGGYVSLPVVMAGKLLRKKLGLHEQNIYPGVANRILAKLVDRIFISIKGSEKFFPKGKVIFSGNPVRKSLLKKEKRKEGIGLLILGGSLGAKFINEVALKVVPSLLEELKELEVIHQTGMQDFKEVKKRYEEFGVLARFKERLKVMDFIEDMGWAYSRANLVLGRAGATTLAELFATGTPALFIPFPFATHNHQEKNARAVAEKGGAVLILQKEATPERVYSVLKNLLLDKNALKRMSEVMKSFYIPDSEKVIIKEMEAVLVC